MRDGLIIASKRLILRPVHDADAQYLPRLLNDPIISLNTVSVPYPYAGRDARRFLSLPRGADERDLGVFMMTMRSNPRIIVGGIGLHVRKGGKLILGYWVGRAYRRRGFAGEACRALIGYAFTLPGVECIHISHKEGNRGSQRVIERLGSRFTRRDLTRSALLRRRAPVLHYVLERKVWRRLEVAAADESERHEGVAGCSWAS